ncbi:FtsX-like permease family protein [Streptomyces sp. CT34]|uniref:ABC transporter permease n=1 Tax=Streptomyces sp. CT34 TaxID=1553907 RepID=UPI001F524680|nr:FtsX-like permease family protein [Streptomyces sp. CT34]
MLQALLARQVREIGILKGIGARDHQILGTYLTMIGLIAAVATAVSIWPSVAIGRLMAQAVADMLNIDTVNAAPPAWVALATVVAGLAVPYLIALLPLTRASRRTVREAFDDHEAKAPPRRRTARSWDAGRTVVMAFRNAFRRKGRLVLSVTLVAAAGAMLMTGLNTASAWRTLTDDALRRQTYDLEVRLDHPQDVERLAHLVGAVHGVRHVAPSASFAALAHPGPGIPVTATYPDKEHGSFTALTVDPGRPLLRPAPASGRWLCFGEKTAVVLNQQALARFPGARAGDRITLGIHGRTDSWQLAGVTEEIGPATAYFATGALDDVRGKRDTASLLRIVSDRHDDTSRRTVLAGVERTLTDAGTRVRRGVPVSELRESVEGHVSLLIGVVIGIAAVMGLVGLLGLGATMATNVTERRREFAVLRTLGADPAAVRRIVIYEVTAAAALSTVLALTVPAFLLLGNVLGNASFRLPLPLHISFAGIVLWVLLALIGSVLATWATSRRTSRTPVHGALTAL